MHGDCVNSFWFRVLFFFFTSSLSFMAVFTIRIYYQPMNRVVATHSHKRSRDDIALLVHE